MNAETFIQENKWKLSKNREFVAFEWWRTLLCPSLPDRFAGRSTPGKRGQENRPHSPPQLSNYLLFLLSKKIVFHQEGQAASTAQPLQISVKEAKFSLNVSEKSEAPFIHLYT